MRKKYNENQNDYWDRIADEYAEEIMSIQPVFYKNAGGLIDQCLRSGFVVADIGNGGVINYSYKNLTRLDCIDLTVPQTAVKKYKSEKNIRFMQGNILQLESVQDEEYDRVIIQCVIHHLAGPDYQATRENTIKALLECKRILKRNGELLVVESTVVPWFEVIERALYRLMQLFFKIIRFDAVYQYSADSLVKLVEENDIGRIEQHHSIPIGEYMWLLKKKVKNKFTPCRAEWIRIKKQ